MAKPTTKTAPASSYTVDVRQETMPDLPTQAPVVFTEAQEDERRLNMLSPEERARAIAAKYRSRGRPAPAGQMGFGFAATAANQVGLFDGGKRR